MTVKELYFVDTLVSVKYNKTLKTLQLPLYESIQHLMSYKCLLTNRLHGKAAELELANN